MRTIKHTTGGRKKKLMSLMTWDKQLERVRGAFGSESAEPPSVRRGPGSDTEVEAAFRKLADVWREETGHLSSVTAMSVHPAYQRIIGLGPQVVPVILRDLEREPDHWFWALSALTGENPILDEHAGDLLKMSEDWIKFGRERGYL
jgi:hypothetical protein